MGLYHIMKYLFVDREDWIDGLIDEGGQPRPKVIKYKNPKIITSNMLGPDLKIRSYKQPTEPQDKPFIITPTIQIPKQKKKKSSSRRERLLRAREKFGGQP